MPVVIRIAVTARHPEQSALSKLPVAGRIAEFA